MNKNNDSPEDRRRVAKKIASLIIVFYKSRRSKPVFICDELHQFVYEHACVAPASPDRILRLLRREGHLDYKVTDRKNSEYTFYYQEDVSA